MPPQTSSAGSLDPQAVAFAKAIRQVESGGNPTAKGKSGEYGAYQFTQPTWQKMSAEAGINVPLEQSTLEQQNQVAYHAIKRLKDQGLNPGQIASSWNAGEGEKDAYTGRFSNGQPSIGVNKYGARFDVPAYAKSVATAYHTLKQGGQVQADPQNPSSIANQTPVQPQQEQGMLSKIAGGIGSFFRAAEAPFLGVAAIPTQLLAKGLGQEDPFKKGILGGQTPGDVTPLNLEQKVGDIAQVGSYMLPGSGVGSAAAMGVLQGAGQAMSENKSASDVALQGGIGGVLGGTIGLAGKAAEYLPQRLARTFLPGTNAETARYAVTKGLGRPKVMLDASEKSLSELGGKIGRALNTPEVTTVMPITTAEDVLPQVLSQYPNSGLTPKTLAEQIKKLVPLEEGLVDKLFTTGLNPQELNNLKSAIGNATYKTVFDEPAVKAGKTLGNSLYQTISEVFKQKLPETTPLFEEYTKELKLNGALMKAVRSGDKARPFTLRDIVALMTGMTAAGPVGGLGVLAGEKILTNPSANLVTAGLLNRAATPIGKAVGKAAIVGGTQAASNLR